MFAKAVLWFSQVIPRLADQNLSTVGTERSGRISKMGDRFLREISTVRVTVAPHHAAGDNDALRRRTKDTLKRKAGLKYCFEVTALANKLARNVFWILRSGHV